MSVRLIKAIRAAANEREALDLLEKQDGSPQPVALETQYDIAHTKAGFVAGFTSEHGRKPTEQEIWNHAIRSWRDLNPVPQPVAARAELPNAKAAQSSAKLLLERYFGAKCDCAAVSGCLRCNSVYLASWAQQVLKLDRAQPVAVQEAMQFNTTDDELSTLLGLTADIAQGHANMDTAIYWHETLLSVQNRLASTAPAAPTEQADYELVLEDHKRLVRELDVILNGEPNAAPQASLCDLVGQCAMAFKTPPFAQQAAPKAEQAQAEITDAELKQIWLSCKSIDNEGFCLEFARAAIRASKGEKL